jgi:hypothetical protein
MPVAFVQRTSDRKWKMEMEVEEQEEGESSRSEQANGKLQNAKTRSLPDFFSSRTRYSVVHSVRYLP